MAPAAKPPITPAAIRPPPASAGAGAATAVRAIVAAAARAVRVFVIASPHAVVDVPHNNDFTCSGVPEKMRVFPVSQRSAEPDKVAADPYPIRNRGADHVEAVRICVCARRDLYAGASD